MSVRTHTQALSTPLAAGTFKHTQAWTYKHLFQQMCCIWWGAGKRIGGKQKGKIFSLVPHYHISFPHRDPEAAVIPAFGFTLPKFLFNIISSLSESVSSNYCVTTTQNLVVGSHKHALCTTSLGWRVVLLSWVSLSEASLDSLTELLSAADHKGTG